MLAKSAWRKQFTRLSTSLYPLHACRAYKLGKRRWSYNQFELVLFQDGVDSAHARSLAVMETTYCKEASADEGSSIGQVMPSSNLCAA